jgi:hypothetical protein
MTEPYRTKSTVTLKFWLARGRKLLGDCNASGSELRAASIGVRSADQELGRKLERRAVVEIGKFNQKQKQKQ